MDEKQITIGEIISGIAIRMKQLGYEESTIDRQYRHYFLCIAHFYRATGRIYYSPDITAEYLEMQKERYEREEISRSQYMHLRCGANRLNEFFITGTVHLQAHKRGTVYDLSESSCTNKSQAHEDPGRCFILAHKGRNPPAEGTEQGDPEEGQAELSDSTAELHSESHTLILDEEYLEPVPYYVEVLPDLHIGFDQDLHDLVDDYQQDSEDQEFLSFSETH